MIEGNFKMKSEVPEWFTDIDTKCPKIEAVLDSGYDFVKVPFI